MCNTFKPLYIEMDTGHTAAATAFTCWQGQTNNWGPVRPAIGVRVRQCKQKLGQLRQLHLLHVEPIVF